MASFNSVLAGGSAAAPGAGDTLATITAPGDGFFYFNVTTFQTGTVDSHGVNAVLKVGGTVIGPLVTAATPTTLRGRFRVPASTNVTVVVGASAGGIGSIYNAAIAVCPIDGRGAP